MTTVLAVESLRSTPFVVLRLYEFASLVLWAIGFGLVRRYGGTKLLLGLYLGTTGWFMWDWLFTDSWFLNLTYDERSIMLFRLDDRPEPLWSPASYGFFFGIATLVVLRHRAALHKLFGRWFIAVFAVGMALFDLIVEGFVVSVLEVYSYGYRDSWKIWGIPVTNMVWVILIEALMIATYSAFIRMQHDRGQLAVIGDPEFTPAATSEDRREPWVIAVLSFSVAAAAVYVGTTVMAFVLAAFDPWTN